MLYYLAFPSTLRAEVTRRKINLIAV